jgi:hypothetical protein
MARIPSSPEYCASAQPQAAQLDASSLHFMVMATCATASARLSRLLWCRTTGVKCVAYLDSDCGHLVPTFMRSVTPDEYMHGHLAHPRDCCNASQPPRDDFDLVPADPRTTTYGPNWFFCLAHRRATLAMQYRHLPALAHARAELAEALQRGSLKWLVFLDDDSFVAVPTLLRMLAEYDHTLPLQVPCYTRPHSAAPHSTTRAPTGADRPRARQIGDFILSSQQERGKWWVRLFACGGAGTILSAAGVRAANFGACHRTYRRSCLQADWMISGCTAMFNVTALPDPGCHACADDSGGSALLHALEHGCVSAQYKHTNLPFLTSLEDRAMQKEALAMLISRSAIVHIDATWIVHVDGQLRNGGADGLLNLTTLLMSKADPTPRAQRAREAQLARELRLRWWEAGRLAGDRERVRTEHVLNVRRCTSGSQ